MAGPIIRFPLDPTGVNPNNLVENEPQTLNSGVQNRAIAPIYGPFFSSGLIITDTATNTPLSPSQYSVVDLLQDATMLFGQGIYSVILITDSSVSNNVLVTYQVLGGEYQNSASGIVNAYETLLGDNRPVNWVNVLNKPTQFPATLHNHLLADVYGFQSVVAALERVRNAVILSDVPTLNALVTWMNNLYSQQEISLLNTVNDLKKDIGNLLIPVNYTGSVVGSVRVFEYTASEDIIFLPNMGGTVLGIADIDVGSFGFTSPFAYVYVEGNIVGSLYLGNGADKFFINTEGFNLSTSQTLTIVTNNIANPNNLPALNSMTISGSLTGVSVNTVLSGSTPYLINTGIDLPNGNDIVLQYVFPTQVTFIWDFLGSIAYAETPPLSTYSLNVFKNGSPVGSVIFNAGSNKGYIDISTSQFVAGDVLTIVCPSVTDIQISNINISLVGQYIPAIDNNTFIYDISGGFIGNQTNNEVLLNYVSPRNISIPAGFTGSKAYAEIPPYGSTGGIFTVTQNGNTIGTITFTPGSNTGSFAGNGATIAVGDTIKIVGPSIADPNLSTVSISLLCNYAVNDMTLLPVDFYGGLSNFNTINEQVLSFFSSLYVDISDTSKQIALCDTPPANSLSLPISINEVVVGSVNIPAGSTVGSFTYSISPFILNPGDRFNINGGSYIDTSITGLRVSIGGETTSSILDMLNTFATTIDSGYINPLSQGSTSGTSSTAIIDTPLLSLTATNNTISASGSQFLLSSGVDVQSSSTWQIATDSAFINVVQTDSNDAVNLTSYTFLGLQYATVYYVRVMYNGASGSSSPWSNTATISTQPIPIAAIGLFGAGYNGGAISNVSIYSYTTNAVSFGGNLFNSTYALAATSNAFIGLFVGGNNTYGGASSTSSVYTYSSNNSVSGGNISFTDSALAATGNSIVGVFGGGYNTATLSTTTVFTYSSDTFVTGGNLVTASSYLAAAGNDTIGVFGGGISNGTYYSLTSVYTYSSNTTQISTSLSVTADELAAGSNTSTAIFSGGYTGSTISSTISIYAFASGAVTVGSNLSYGAYGLACAGNSSQAVFGGGSGGSTYLSTTSIYLYANGTAAAGTNLTTSAENLAACGPNQGVNC